MADRVEEFVAYAVKSLATEPGEVQVSRVAGSDKDTVTVRVNSRDRGRVVGRQGRTIRAISTIVNIIAAGGRGVSVTVAD